MPKVGRALVSVYQKEGLLSFVQELINLNIEILSTGGTAKLLRERNMPVIQVSDYTGFPEILNGRVKTLHPKIHAGILALRDLESHMDELRSHEIETIDMVVVNLYPFLEVIQKKSVDEIELLENIDIGGPTLIRAAAKNYLHVVPVTAPAQYQSILSELRKNKGEISVDTSRKLAVEAFRKVAHYDGMIARYFAGKFEIPEEVLPENLSIAVSHTYELRYGENPHQKAGYYQGDLTSKISGLEQLHGIPLSYNNIVDAEAAIRLVQEFTQEPTVAIIKHTNPCGVGKGESLLEAYQRANATDPISSFGSILCANKRVDMPLAEKLRKHFIEVLLAPDFAPEALRLLQEKKKLRIMRFDPKILEKRSVNYRSILNGMLLQEADNIDLDQLQLKVVTKREPTEDEWQSLRFAWKVVKHVKSNAIV